MKDLSVDRGWKARLGSVLAGVLMLCGCAQLENVVPPDATVQKQDGYFAGTFTRLTQSGGFAVVVRNVASGAKHTIPMGTPLAGDDTQGTTAVVAFRLPPGTYRAESWFTYSLLTKISINETDIPETDLGGPFQVQPGAVTYFGDFDIRTDVRGTRIEWSFQARRVSSAFARRTFVTAYPAFDAMPFKCHLCVDSRD